MSGRINRKRDTKNSKFREGVIRTPDFRPKLFRLHKYQVNKEQMTSLAELLQEPDCVIENLEIVNAGIDLNLATKFMEGITIQKCTVKQITFENCRFKFDAMTTVMEAIKNNTSVRKLRMKSVVIHEKEACVIADMLKENKFLKELTLSQCGLDDAGIIQIALSIGTCRQLKYLDLRNNNFEVQGLQSLVDGLLKMGSCKTLMLEDIEIDEEQAIFSLKKLFGDQHCQIEVLELNSLFMNENASLQLLTCIKNATNLKHLSLKKNTFTISFMEILAKEIQNLRALQILNLSHCELTDEVFEKFCENLVDSNLQELNVSWNQLSTIACADLRRLLETNSSLQTLLLQHNQLGGYCFSQLANAITQHQGIRYLDISWNKIFNGGFKHIFQPVSKNKTKLEHLECRGNGLGGPELDDLLFCISRSLKLLDLSNNNLSQQNGEILKSYAQKNVWMEMLSVEENAKIVIENMASIRSECMRNIKIKHFILPRLETAKSTGFIHKSLTNNCYQEFDVSELTFQDLSFFKLDFLAKFMIENKESFEKLRLINVQIEEGGEALTNVLKGQTGDLDLKTIYLENVNLSYLGLKDIIGSCAKMLNLREFALINMEKVQKESIQQMLFKAFKSHKHLELLDLRANKLQNFDMIVQIMENNRHIKSINVRGSTMSVDNLGIMWLALRQNTSVMEFEHQRERVAFAFTTLQLVEIELTLNREINEIIMPIVEKQNEKHQTSLDLTGAEIFNMEAILKYLRIHKSIKELNLQNSNLDRQMIIKLVNALVKREVQLSRLNLSKNESIDDTFCPILAHLFSQRSTLKHLFLDETKITEEGVGVIVESITENLKVQTLSFRKCKVYITDPIASPQWNLIKNVLKQNCSLTLLDLQDNNNNVDDQFIKEIDVDIQKNQKIVENIFPKLLEQEEKAQKKLTLKKEKQKKTGKAEDPLTQKGKDQKRQKQRRRSSFDTGQLLNSLPQNLLNIDSPKGHTKNNHSLSSAGSQRRRSRMINIHQDLKKIETQKLEVNELVAIAEEAKQEDRKSVQEEYTDSLDIEESSSNQSEVSKSNSQMSGALSVQEDEDGFDLALGDMNVKDLSFLTKFMTQFKKIKNIDIGESKLKQKELGELTKAVQQNPYIQEIKLNGSGSRKAKALMQAELDKNKAIQIYGATANDNQDNSQIELNLASQGQGLNVQAVSKMIKFKAALQDLNLSGNKLGNHGAKDVSEMIDENNTIQRLKLKDCGIGSQGLQQIVSALCKQGNDNLQSLDIRGNFVPDKHLKMLLVLMYKNRNIQEIQYTLINPENEARKEEYIQMIEQQSLDAVTASQKILGHGHHDHYHWWHYVLFFPWVWKSFVHAKHEAFAFKYDPEIMRLLEEQEMRPIRVMMYFWSVVYYIILFALPFFFKQDYCGGLFYNGLYFCYGVYALLNAGWEVYVVLRIQNQIRRKLRKKNQAKKLLDFNRWHVVELFMGQIARLDTFLDFLFIVIIMKCPELRVWLAISSFYMIANSIFPLYQLTKRVKMEKSHLSHTMPYMEENNFLSFVRENMLLATVVDSFCINNTKSIFKRWNKGKGIHVTFGRLMGTLTFFLQDFPQFTLHACFKIYPYFFSYSAVHYHLKGQQLLLISMFVSGAAVAISCFNMVMCVENEFDPVLLETALQKRRAEVAERNAEEERQRELFKKQKTKRDSVTKNQALKNAFLASLMKYATTEEQKQALQQKKDIAQVQLNTTKRLSTESSLLKKFKQFNTMKSSYLASGIKINERKVELIPTEEEMPVMMNFQNKRMDTKISDDNHLDFKQKSLRKRSSLHDRVFSSEGIEENEKSSSQSKSSRRSQQFVEDIGSQMELKFNSGPLIVKTDCVNSPQIQSGENTQTQIMLWNSGMSQDGNGVTRNDFNGAHLDSNQNSFIGGLSKNILIQNSSADLLLTKEDQKNQNSMSFLPSITDRKVNTFQFAQILGGTEPDSMSDGNQEGEQPSDEAEEYYTGKGNGPNNLKRDRSQSDEFQQDEVKQQTSQQSVYNSKPQTSFVQSTSKKSEESQFRYKMKSGKVNIVSPI